MLINVICVLVVGVCLMLWYKISYSASVRYVVKCCNNIDILWVLGQRKYQTRLWFTPQIRTVLHSTWGSGGPDHSEVWWTVAEVPPGGASSWGLCTWFQMDTPCDTPQKLNRRRAVTLKIPWPSIDVPRSFMALQDTSKTGILRFVRNCSS